jgi:ABC-type oligopeptide transport system substrate-binding subunit
VVAHTFNPITQEAGAGGSLAVPSQPGLQSESQDGWGYTETLSQKSKQVNKQTITTQKSIF